MEAYKQRMIKEYRELKERADKLATMLDKWDKGTLDFTPTCPKYLLDKQLETMQEYAGILQTRAKLEDVDLNASVDAAAPETEWVPVSERMPEEYNGASVPVLVTVERQLEGDKFVTMAFTMNGHWSCFGAEITAWMPSPKPYKGNDEENKNEDSGK